MLRFQTAAASLIGSALVLPVLLGQGSLATLQDALSGTTRAIEVLKGLEKRLQDEPAAVLGLVLSATEVPSGDERQSEERLDALRSEVNLLQLELDAMQSPLLAADGAVQGALGTREPLDVRSPAPAAGITTGLDDSMRALLQGVPAPKNAVVDETRGTAPRGSARGGDARTAEATEAQPSYSADPLKNGIACYRAGRFAEALELLTASSDAPALYWRARTLERLERIDEAIQTLELALQKGGQAPELRRAQTDLEFLRWKRDFLASLPKSRALSPEKSPAKPGKEPR